MEKEKLSYRGMEIPVFNRQGDPLSPEQQKMILTIIDDFKVNDDIAMTDQSHPAIAIDGSGNFFITWEGYCNGNYDVFARRFNSSGTPQDSNFMVNDDAGTAQQHYPAIAVDALGNFVITWQDYRNGNYDIYAQRFNSSGTAQGSNFKVNTDAGTALQDIPAIATDGSGNFVITWGDYRNSNGDIYAQRYNSSGTAQGSNFKVNDDVGTAGQAYPAIAIDYSGSFIITWEDYRNGNGDIYAQRYNSSGAAQGSNFKVNTDFGTALQYVPAIAIDGSGNFIITWQDYRNSGGDIYAQRFNSSGAPQGSNFMVNSDAGTAAQQYPAIALDGSGDFVITWDDERNGVEDIYAQRYNSSGTPQGANFKVNDDTINIGQYFPRIASEASGNFVITWQDWRNYNYDIYAQRYNFSGTPQGSNFEVNNDTVIADQFSPVIAVDDSGDFVLSWYDGRNGNSDIIAQCYNSSGTPQGVNFQVNIDAGTAPQAYPAIAVSHTGNFIITWEDYLNGNWDIYAQRYNSSGTPLSSIFKVNTDPGTAAQYVPSIAIDGSGDFVITWQDYRNSNWDIYAQRYNSSGTPQGSNFKVNNDPGTSGQFVPVIARDSSGNFVISWEDYRNGNLDIYAQFYHYSGTPQGSNFKVNDDTGTAVQQYPAIAQDGSGDFVITWMDQRNSYFDIYAQRYNSLSTPQGANFKVNDDAGVAWQEYPAAAMDNSGNFVITWQDWRNDNPDIFAQRYKSSGNPFGVNYLVTDPLYSSYDQEKVAVGVKDSSIYFTWEDNRNGDWDIYAKVVDWAWPSTCGDANGDGKVTVSDVVYLINYLFKGGPAPLCPPAPYLTCGDANGDGKITVSDVVYLINYLFKGGPAPVC
jgi:hypothetical protein